MAETETRISRLEGITHRHEEDIRTLKKTTATHLQEAEVMKNQVAEHRAKLYNGEWNTMQKSINNLHNSVIRLETLIDQKEKGWGNIAVLITTLGTLVSVIYLLVQVT